MMHPVSSWPEGCLLLLSRMTCVFASNAHDSIFTRAHGVGRNDVADYADCNMHNYFIYLFRTIAMSCESFCST